MFYLSLILNYFKNYAKTKLTYRADFWIEVLSDLSFQVVNLIFIIVVFRHTPTLGGWTETEVIFVYGFFMIPYGIFETFFNMWNFSDRYIVKGEMDRVLTRPAHSWFQVILENMDPPALIGSTAGLIIMINCWQELGLTLHFWDIPIVIVFIISAVLIYAGIYTALDGDFVLLRCTDGYYPAHV